jgi:hypothetical protein
VHPVILPELGIRRMFIRCAEEGGGLLFAFFGDRAPYYDVFFDPEHLKALTDANERVHVYQYDPATNQLQRASLDTWRRASGELSGDGMRRSPSNTRAPSHDPVNHVLLWENQPVPLAGQTLLATCGAHRGTRTAVLSATGRARKPLMPFASFTAGGDRLHQIVEIVGDKLVVGPPIRLEVTTTYDDISPMWTPDDTYVVYHRASFEKLWVIPVSEEQDGQP